MHGNRVNQREKAFITQTLCGIAKQSIACFDLLQCSSKKVFGSFISC